ncbi:hypothetical protein GOEFS_041_00310 [Gordonia effusa NBRC 100432]|uniref:Transmembrane protein n=1 Tax=Gordonia effusa NBRC 100432 TaxID=1077974 RepID=H0QYH6_9ACTN|nr:hypothetical protein GOEFS_041_00310 [Gordonia effusa NBRC 100432]
MRPKLVESMAIALELWLVVIVGRIVASCGLFQTVKSNADGQLTNPLNGNSEANTELIRSLSSTWALIAMLVVSAIIVGGISLTVMWFARQGYNWARMVTAGASLYVVVTTILDITVFGVEPTWVGVPLIIAGVAAGGALVALLRRDTEKWCADMALYRQQSKAFAAMPRGPIHPPTAPPPPAAVTKPQED